MPGEADSGPATAAATAESKQSVFVPRRAVRELPIVPGYGQSMLATVLPGAARALGADLGLTAVSLPTAQSVCVVIVDGLGWQLLAEAGSDAPFLAELASAGSSLRVGFPTTTATSMGSFGTGLPPGQHGLVGYEVLDPDRGVLLNELRWDPLTDPLRWQPFPTIFQMMVERGVAVTRIGNPEFADSGLTMAAHRGGDFIGLSALTDRADAALAAMAAGGPALVYLYWGEVDAAGHVAGWRSQQWRAALRELDSCLAAMAVALPAGTLLVVTADHGMVDVPHAGRLDLQDHPVLKQDVVILGGEPRMGQLYCTPGRSAAVAERLADALGDHAWIRTRDEAIGAGWFGPVSDRVRPRIGDVLVAARGSFALVDSASTHRHILKLIGHHGSLSEDEQLVPLLVHAA